MADDGLDDLLTNGVDPQTQQMLVDAGLVPQRFAIAKQRLALGQSLMGTPQPQGQRVGPYHQYVASSPLEHISAALQNVIGARMAKGALSQEDAAVQRLGRGRAAAAQGLPGAAAGGDVDYSALFGSDPNAAQSQAAALAQAIRQRRQAGQAAVASGDPSIAAVGQEGMSAADKMEQDLVGAGKSRAEMALQGQHLTNEERRIAAQEDMWRNLATTRQEEADTKAKLAGLKEGETMQTHDTWGNPITVRKYQGQIVPVGGQGGSLLPRSTAAAGGAGGPSTPAPGVTGGAPGSPLSGASPSSGPIIPPSIMSPEALDQAAEQFASTGQLPRGGYGRATALVTSAIRTRAAQLHPDLDLTANASGYQADTASLAKLTKQADATNAFENTALSNLQTFLDSAHEAIPDTGSPLLNAPWREFKSQIQGDPQMAKLVAARETAVNEISKVLSGSLGTAGVTEGAKRDAAGMLSPNASLAQIDAAAEILKRDMANRHQAFDAQIGAIQGRIKGRGRQTSPPAPGGNATPGGAQGAPNDPLGIR